jgi:hypothetical protein
MEEKYCAEYPTFTPLKGSKHHDGRRHFIQ